MDDITAVELEQLRTLLQRLEVERSGLLTKQHLSDVMQRLGFRGPNLGKQLLPFQKRNKAGLICIDDFLHWCMSRHSEPEHNTIINKEMLAFLSDSSKKYKFFAWCHGLAKPHFYIYKDEDEHVNPGTEVQKDLWGSFKTCGGQRRLLNIPSVAERASRKIDLYSHEFRWFQQMLRAKTSVVMSGDTKPWVVVLMGTPGIGKSTLMQGPDALRRDDINQLLPCKV